MQLFDSLSRRLRDFEPSDPRRTTVYGCGPTVYDFAHIGNFRAFVVYDLLHRHLRGRGHNVDFVVNFTDVDDKTIAGAAAAGRDLASHTARYVEAFLGDSRRLGLLDFRHRPRATAHIDGMTAFVQRLVERGSAYVGSDGSVYYAVESFPSYGRLSGKGGDDAGAHSRIDGGAFGKRDPRDFALWKAAQPEDAGVGAVWESPWGPGRPGWHLECSVMAGALLGDTIDIHLGGEDLLFPHHENEIAQSEAANGATFARFWLHVKHLKVDGRKMSKSLGNFHTVRDLTDRGHDPAAIRWVLLSAHYRNELNFTLEGLDEAGLAVQRLLDFRRRVTEFPGLDPDAHPNQGGGAFAGAPWAPRGTDAAAELADCAAAATGAFLAAMDRNLNAPRAVAALWTMVREVNAVLDRAPGGIAESGRGAVLAALARMDAVLGVLDVAEGSRRVDDETEDRIRRLVAARGEARAERDFATADRLRDELEAEGVRLEDTPSGTRWTRVRAVRR